MGMPIWWMMYQEAKSIGKKVLAAGVVLLMLVMISKTGSRGALISFAVLMLVVFLRVSLLGKMKLVIGGFVLLALLVAIMPGRLLRRYQTLGEDIEPVGLVGQDYDVQMMT